MENNDAQISGFAVVKKNSKSLKEKLFKKKNSSSLFLQIRPTNFFKINESRNIKISVIFRFRKIVLHHKIINKTRSTTNQENPARHFGVLETIISQIIS